MSTEQADPLGETPGERIVSYLIGVPSMAILFTVTVGIFASPVLNAFRSQDPQMFTFGLVAVFGIGFHFAMQWVDGEVVFGGTGGGEDTDEEDEEEDSGEFLLKTVVVMVFFNSLVYASAFAGSIVLELGLGGALAVGIALVWPEWEVYTATHEPYAIPLSLFGAAFLFIQFLETVSKLGGRLANWLQDPRNHPDYYLSRVFSTVTQG